MGNIIEIKNLKKSFKDVKAVDDISFVVKKGELFSFLGVNGAGKSTTIAMICGTLKPDGGSIVIDGVPIGEDVGELKSKIGVVFQNTVLDEALTVKQNLTYRAALYNMCRKETSKKIKELASILDFGSYLNRPYKKLSGGQKRRIDVARALINDPSILILDEPTTGLDPQTRKLLWAVITKLRKERGMTVFLTTHYMEEASESDDIVIIDSGKIIAKGTPVALKNRYTGDYITIYGKDESTIKLLKKPYAKVPGAFRVRVKDTAEAKSLIIQYPQVFEDFEIVKGSMDDVFLNATGKNLRGDK